jgi:hypothetical protein
MFVSYYLMEDQMLICKSRKFKRRSECGRVEFHARKASCCHKELNEWFDVPEDAEFIRFHIHNCPSKHRYHVMIHADLLDNEPWVNLYINGQTAMTVGDPLWRGFSKKFRDKLVKGKRYHCYVEVEYK